MHLRRSAVILAMLTLALAAWAQMPDVGKMSARKFVIQPSFAWTALQPLGLRQTATIDTLFENYNRQSIPNLISDAWACTGNYGAEGINMIYMDRAPISSFFLQDAQQPWLPSIAGQKFYNTRVPMTLVSYNTGGQRDTGQDRLSAVFSGNVNSKLQVGANVDFIYSHGYYSNQAAKGFTWGLNGSYIGDRYEFQGSWNHFNNLNQENGGITDDLYIIDPAELQGGVTTINPKSIPTRLTKASTRIRGGQLFLNNRYNVGYWHEEKEGDSVVSRKYIPVTSFIWTLNYTDGWHRFRDRQASETRKFFENTYLDLTQTRDYTEYYALSNSVGVSLLEGFHKYAKFGLAAYLTYELRKFTQTRVDKERVEGLTPLPDGITAIKGNGTENMIWVGAQLTKQRGAILTYEATGELGIAGDAAGEVRINGRVDTRIPLLGDTVKVGGFGSFTNTVAPYLLNHYLSNHFIWKNDFGMERKLRIGGRLEIPRWRTHLEVGIENVQNLLYFNDMALPAQCGSSIQVLSARLRQDFKVGILHWDNQVTYQVSSNKDVIALPELAAYTNLYIQCRIATLRLQLGASCDYYTSYYAPAYQPATATFHNQHDIKIGNYPFVTVYANMKLSRARFYVQMAHINCGVFGGNNYFSSPHYPLNPSQFLMGVSVDFAN